MLGRRSQRKLLGMVHGEESGIREWNNFGGRRRSVRRISLDAAASLQ
jgi:hypothetical protein